MDFFDFFRKVQDYANLERDISGFLKIIHFSHDLGKKRAKNEQKAQIQKSIFFNFLNIFEYR